MYRWQTAGFGLYVHWPFCQSKCPYCDFNSHVSEQIDNDLWRDAYLSEMRQFAVFTPDRVIQSIFFGGGTPSLMPASTAGAIIDEAVRLWTPANNIEITLEANPTSVEIGKFKDFRNVGVNRVSIGIQALNDADLRRLGRLHDSAEARQAIRVSQAIFDRTSFDLIYARQHQDLGSWASELAEALVLAGEHLSLYQLTIEPGTVFGARHERGLLAGLPTEDVSADMYELTQAMCSAHGFNQYEVSNHAHPGSESRHNMIYLRCGDYVGIGPGAHGRLTHPSGDRFATVRPSAPDTWLASTKERLNSDGYELLQQDACAAEFILMGLRLATGVDLAEYQAIAGRSLSAAKLRDLTDQGLINVRDGRLMATPTGHMLLNSVIKELI